MRRDPDFHQQVLSRFNLELEGKLPNMLKALERECLAGNINGLKLMLEYLNKLQKNINITIKSPYEQWLQAKGLKAEDAEIVESISDFKELPPRTKNNNHLVVHEERVKLNNRGKKEERIERRNKNRVERKKWLKRAKAVGVDPLPARRPTPGQKKIWRDSIRLKEKQALGRSQEQADNNKTPYKPKTPKQENPKIPTPQKT